MAAVLLGQPASAVTKIHVIAFGKWITVQWTAGNEEAKPVTLKIRPLVVDGRVKEYALGAPHEITERLFVVRRAFRVNDSLPEEAATRWQWQRGGWLLVDRETGRVSPVALPEFDAFYSAVSWYRDYAAYCGVSEDGKKIFEVVGQIGRRKPVLRKAMSDAGVADNAGPDSACAAPAWQRDPVRVSFEAAGKARETFAIRGRVVDLVSDAEEEEEGSK